MKNYTTPKLTAKGNSVELTKFIPNRPEVDGSAEPTDGLAGFGNLGFSL